MPNLNNQVSGSAIAFIDTQVENYQSLIAGVKLGTEVVVLDENRDAIDQITDILALRTNIDSIHIISHGSPGSLQLGDGSLSLDNLEAYSEQLQQWQSALNLGADILIYGCNVASASYPKIRQGLKPQDQSSSRLKPTEKKVAIKSSKEDFSCETGVSNPGGTDEYAIDDEGARDIDGFAFIQRIAQLTNTNVAASQNLTGSVAKGGDWELEVRTGKIETPLVFKAEVLASYEYVLNTFGAATNFGAGSWSYGINVGNFNPDPFPDLVVANYLDSNISILLGNGTGSFGTATNFPAGQTPNFVTSGLFNNDNFPDLALAYGNFDTVSILLGNGTGGFGAPSSFSVGRIPLSIAVGNFNADTFLDLAVVNADSISAEGTVSILLGNGAGRFSAATNFNVGSIATSVVVGNFNADSLPDLAVANSVSNNVSILLGNGTGGFGAATNFGAGISPQAIATGDFNGDNFLDLATANQDSKNVSILLGNGTGGFGTRTDFSAGTGLRSLVAKDLNGDNKLDLAVAGTSGAAILAGNGNGGFSAPINFAAGTEPYSIIAGNFNADTLPDLAVANRGSGNVSVLLNTPNTVNFGAATYSDTEGTTDTVVNIPVTISGGTPFADVVVPIAIDKSSTATPNLDYTISPTSITFPAGATGAALTQNVAFTIKPDNIAENSETAILNFGTITGGVAGTTKQTTLTIAANGTVSYAIAAGTASIPEGNSGTKPLTFTATRSGNTGGASSVNYTIGGTATNVSDYNNIGGTSGATAATGTINFGAGETSKTITLDGLGDTIVEPDETIAVTLSSPTGPGVTPTITTATATTTITNDDKAGFTVNPLSGLTTSEVGGQAKLTVKLNAQPTANVTIGLRSDNAAEGTVSTNSLTFTDANYNQPQTITVSGVDDFVADGPIAYKIVTAAAVSTDANFNNLDPDDVTVSNNDNETPGITVNPTAGLTTGENGTKANFAVVLNTQPVANVTIGLNSDNVAEGTVATNSLTFTPANWNTPQPVTVTGIEDSIADGDINYKIITGSAVSTDANYNNRNVADVSLSNQDNDAAGVSITPTQTTATEGGANGTYNAVLTSQPIAPVTITLTTGNQIGAIAPITFTDNNWNIAQTVTVQAVDDTIVEGAHSVNITHSVSSTDTQYNAIVVSGVTVAIADNDVAPPPAPVKPPLVVEPPVVVNPPVIVISPDIIIKPASGLVTTETGGTDQFTLTLNSQPTADVKIDVRSNNEAEGVISTESITFNSANWKQPQTITVTGVDDSVADGDKTYQILTAPAVSTDSNYSGLNAADVAVTNTDNVPPADQPNSLFIPLPPGKVVPEGDLNDPTVKRQRLSDIKFDLIDDPQQNLDEGLLKLNLFKDTSFDVIIDKVETSSNGESWVRIGRIQGALDDSEVILINSKNDGVAIGNIRYKDKFYQIRYAGNGLHSIREIDEAAFPDSPDFPQDSDAVPVPSDSFADLPEISGDLTGHDPVVIDVMVVYTTSAKNGAGGTTIAMNALINLAETETNLGYTNSGVNQQIRIVHREEISYTESGDASTDLGRLQNPSDGFLDNVQQLRNTHSADMVSLFANNLGICGVAYLMTTPSYEFENFGFSVVDRNCAVGSYSFAHELGHNLGAQHNVENTSSPGAYPYSYGYRDLTDPNTFRTVMSYDTNPPTTRINRWSNPDLTYLGEPTGTPSTNNARTLNNTAIYGANWRHSNDNLEKAKTVSGSSFSTTGLNVNGTKQTEELNHAGNSGGKSIWWSWTAPSSGPVTVSTAGSSFDTLLGVYTGGSVSSLTTVASNNNDPAGGQTSRVAFTATAGTTYKIAVDGFGGSSGSINLNLSPSVNRPPVLTIPFREQGLSLQPGSSPDQLQFTFQNNTFTDPDPNDTLTYTADWYENVTNFEWRNVSGGQSAIPTSWDRISPLPTGMSFDASSRTFRVDNSWPRSSYWIRVTATDAAGASDIAFFDVYTRGEGFVIDGYIAGATVFFDANKNGVKDANESSTITGPKGEYALDIPWETFDKNQNGEIDVEEGNIVAFGGIDTATGLPLETPVTAPADASVVTLLTTLVVDLIDKGVAPETAQSLVKSSLAIPADVDITDFDPIAATNNNQPGGVQVLAAMVKVQNFITQTAALIDGASSAASHDIVKAVVSSITAQILSGTVLNLSNAAALEPIIQQAAAKIQQIDPSFNSQTVTQIISQAATVMATANQRIDSAVSNPTATSIPESLARLQQVALGPTTQDFRQVGTGNKPISQVVADNTGTALDSRIEAVVLPTGIATPLVSGDADLGSNSPQAILGTNGDDILTGDSANNVLMGMRGNDSLDGGLGNDTIFGGKDSDTLLGSSGDDALFCNRGADILNGDDGNDILYGGKGDDLLTGGLGFDTLIGGKGVDKFLLSTNSGTDTITDFEGGKDLLVLGNGLTFSQLAIAQDSGATLIRFAQTGEILAYLRGVSANSISAVNFGLI